MLVGGVSNLRAACPASWIYLDILLFHSGYLYRELSGVGARRYCQSEFHTWCGSQFSITRRRQDVCPFLLSFFKLSFFATFCNKFSLVPTPDTTANMTPYRCQKNVPFFRSCRRYSQAKCGRVRSKRWCSLTICLSLSQCSGSLWKMWLWILGFDLQNASSYDINRFVIPSYLSYLSPEKKDPKVWLIFSHEPMMWDKDCDFIRTIWDTLLM